jgi:two-component system sensor histidine kinase TctE
VVTVGVEAQGQQVVVTVEDNGPGLAAADRERVFQRFVRATYDGTGCGLGLSIAKEIVARHAGSVALEAAQPQGLRAIIRLPRA